MIPQICHISLYDEKMHVKISYKLVCRQNPTWLLMILWCWLYWGSTCCCWEATLLHPVYVLCNLWLDTTTRIYTHIDQGKYSKNTRTNKPLENNECWAFLFVIFYSETEKTINTQFHCNLIKANNLYIGEQILVEICSESILVLHEW